MTEEITAADRDAAERQPAVYIATRLENHKQHNTVRDALAQAGIRITYDWSTHGPVWESGCARIREVSVAELKGITDADFIVVILPGGRGTHTELGFALALGKRVLILAETEEVRRMNGATPETCAFYHHPLVVWTYGMDHLLNYATTIARNRAQPDPPVGDDEEVEVAIKWLEGSASKSDLTATAVNTLVRAYRRLQAQRPEPARVVVTTEQLQHLVPFWRDERVHELAAGINAILASASRGGESAEEADGEPV